MGWRDTKQIEYVVTGLQVSALAILIPYLGKDYNSLAKELTDEINKNPAIMTKYSKSTDPVQWARESFLITKDIYKKLPSNLSSKNQAYVDSNKQTVREQLMAGGIRLAKLLNQIFGW